MIAAFALVFPADLRGARAGTDAALAGRMSWGNRSRRPAGAIFALGVAGVLACESSAYEEDTYQFRQSVLSCEEAVARLIDCCPGFDGARVDCLYFHGKYSGCTTTNEKTINPALSTAESQCIRDTACDSLVSSGVCARAQDARPPSSDVTTHTTGDLPPPSIVPAGPRVCP